MHTKHVADTELQKTNRTTSLPSEGAVAQWFSASASHVGNHRVSRVEGPRFDSVSLHSFLFVLLLVSVEGSERSEVVPGDLFVFLIMHPSIVIAGSKNILSV